LASEPTPALPRITGAGDGTASLSGPLTFGTVPGLYASWQALAHECVRADLKQVTAFDSAGLALLLEWSALLRDQGRPLAVVNAPASLQGLAELCDAGDWLSISGRQS
jgi:ABC-type transporter Mla MlaB component